VELKPTGYPPIALEWPPGYSVTFNPLKVFGPDGSQVAAEGVEVFLGGTLLRAPNVQCGADSTLRVISFTKASLAP
jgi:hypothetical protein